MDTLSRMLSAEATHTIQSNNGYINSNTFKIVKSKIPKGQINKSESINLSSVLKKDASSKKYGSKTSASMPLI